MVYKIAMIGAVLASGITAASAQNMGRNGFDQPTRNWNSGMETGSSYYGRGYGYNEGYGYNNDMRDHNNYGVSKDTLWATPRNDSYSAGER